MCTFRCIDCRKLFTDESAGSVDNSHGLCPACAKKSVTPLFRSRQRKEGNPDCFGKSTGYCDQPNCRYFSLCTATEPKPADVAILFALLNPKPDKAQSQSAAA
jgi:hypothetical protein